MTVLVMHATHKIIEIQMVMGYKTGKTTALTKQVLPLTMDVLLVTLILLSLLYLSTQEELIRVQTHLEH